MLAFKRILIMMMIISTGVSFPSYQEDEILVISDLPVEPSLLSSNLYTQKETDLRDARNTLVSLEGSVLISENDQVALYFNPLDASIDLLQKSTDYVWSSTINIDYAAKDQNDMPIYPDQTTEDDRGLNSFIWRNKVASPVWITYFAGSENNPQLREESLFESPMSTFEYTILSDVVFIELYFGISQVRLTYQVTLTERGFQIQLDQESIRESSNAKLASIAIYPFLGAAKKDLIPGYIMVPDGVGALFRFDQYDQFTSPYQKRLYGQDFAVSTFIDETSIIKDDLDITANTYGMVHGVNQQGYLTIIEEGQAYANMIVYPADVITDFFFAYTSFIVRSSYRQPLNQSQTNSVLRVQEEKNPFNIQMTYAFLANEQANYVGMANLYQQYVVSRDGLTLKSASMPPIHLDVLLQDNKRAFIGRDTFLMTHVRDLIEMVSSFDPTQKLILTLRGGSSVGYSGASLDVFPLSSRVGTQAEWDSLLNKDNVSVYIYVEPLKIYTSSSFHNQLMIARGRHLLPYRFVDDYGSYDYVNPYDYNTRLSQLHQDILDAGFDGIAYDNLGRLIYGSFGDQPFSREDMLHLSQDLTVSNGVFQPYDFAFGAQAIFDLPLTHSLHAKMTDTVPFLTYALAGYQDVFGSYHNYFGNTSHTLLKMIDFHVFPSFQVTQESPYLLLDSPNQTWISTRFDVWEDEIHRQSNVIFDVLSHVYGDTVESRFIPDVGISVITYQSGQQVLVNYTHETYVYDGVKIDPMSAFVREVIR